MPEDIKQILESLFEEVLRVDATDIHLSANRHPILRICSKLTILTDRPILTGEQMKSIADMLMETPEQKNRFATQKDCDLSLAYKDKARFRINIYQQFARISIAMRYIPSKVRTLEELSLPPILHQFTKPSQGFVLVVGPSGHGKSTVLAAMVDEINHLRADHIITIEDPIEYTFVPDKCIIDQREIGIDTPDFHRGLRSMFRQDADVVMVGEMRDQETISTVVTAAETGHLIFSTLHTNTAAQTIDRIIDSFPPYQQSQIRSQLASTLLGIISRRLVPTLQGGIINAVEVLIVNSAVRNLIREGKVHQIDMVINTSIDEGMVSLNRSLADLIKQGIVSLESAELFSISPAELRLLLQN
ncbi:MAG: type IV pili twitching motility protein PilT [Candidatus Portnoybacteria bacterium CG10_big_fil_rev_8_21_14_0_10_36_7]|uniref:Type IV pili twitching motility protein PilT n=1 Tax=Candidatus Portnoybacteria bacterium CG10_big_fil_rev_8_21_14_0_10_36_7 TaxID=1974812 RepID=A0A2M8KDP9_9BACT|nr:MAG: type IV pili twitching motility protein PilT [Candidatus Portnoybacteria bacterium CG10_big_fil_rev_8_21_14_0_10_36_7]